MANAIKNHISNGQLLDAFIQLRQLSEQAMTYELTDRIKGVEQTYTYMLRYMAEGANDPTRMQVYDKVKEDMRALLDAVVRRMLIVETPTLYYNILRTLRLRNEDSISKAVEDYISLCDQKDDSRDGLRERERVERRLFDLVWVQFPLDNNDISALRLLMVSDVPSQIKAAIIGAVTLGLLEFYDPRRFLFLIESYESAELEVSMRAITGLVIGLFRYRNRRPGAEILKAIERLRQTEYWYSDLASVFTELVRTRNTSDLTRKLNDEVMPDILKTSSEIIDKLKENGASDDPFDQESNPLWADLTEHPGFEDAMRRLARLQEEGGDIYMGSFNHLKHFPFFSEAANWFMPYVAERSDFMDMPGDMLDIARMVGKAPGMCDSDKYSMMFSLGMMPKNAAPGLMNGLDEQARHVQEEIEHSIVDPKDKRYAAMRVYVLDLYRFFNLFRRKGEFFNPFGGTFNFNGIAALSPELRDPEIIEPLAEMYFKIGAWEEAAALFARLVRRTEPTKYMYQKAGYSYEKAQLHADAIIYYRNALQLDGDDLWTLRRLSMLLTTTRQYNAAKELLLHIEQLSPDDHRVAYRLGNVHFEEGMFDEALKYYYKADYLKPDEPMYIRAIANTMVELFDYKGAEAKYKRMIAEGAEVDDYVALGQLARLKGNLRDAIDFFTMAAQTAQGDVALVVKKIQEKEDWVTHGDASVSDTPLVVEALMCTLRNYN